MTQRTKIQVAYSQDEPLSQSTMEQRYRPIVQMLKDAFAERLKTAVLFGSQARGEAQPNSDHDIFIVIEDLPRDPLARSRIVRTPLLPILDCLPGPIGFVAKTPDEVEANLTPLLLDVCVEGVCLYGASYFEPYRQKALAALRQSGLRRHRVGKSLMWRLPQAPTGEWELSWQGSEEST